jgi:hypothetical protein
MRQYVDGKPAGPVAQVVRHDDRKAPHVSFAREQAAFRSGFSAFAAFGVAGVFFIREIAPYAVF